jgi:hypothetical protein
MRFSRSVAAVKVCTAGSLLSSKLFTFFVCTFFFETRRCASLPKKPSTIYCVTFRPRFFFSASTVHHHRTVSYPFALHYRRRRRRRFLSLNLLKLLCSRVSRSFQFRTFLQMSHRRRVVDKQYLHSEHVYTHRYLPVVTLSDELKNIQHRYHQRNPRFECHLSPAGIAERVSFRVRRTQKYTLSMFRITQKRNYFIVTIEK